MVRYLLLRKQPTFCDLINYLLPREMFEFATILPRKNYLTSQKHYPDMGIGDMLSEYGIFVLGPQKSF